MLTKNEKNDGIILLDKLVFSCVSSVEDNFDYAITNSPNFNFESEFKFGTTKLKRTQYLKSDYKHTFKVYYGQHLMGVVSFGLIRSNIYDGMVKFAVDNEVFYNRTMKYLQYALNDLNLEINNYTQIDIAADSCKFNAEQIVRRGLKDRDNRIVAYNNERDRYKWFDERVDYNSGTLNNPFASRTVYIKNKPKNASQKLELCCYNKCLEIKHVSHKEYILDYHAHLRKKKKKQIKQLHRCEIRISGRKIYDYEKGKLKRMITLDDLMDKDFLYEMFKCHIDKVLKIYKGKGCKHKLQVYATPNFDLCEDI